MQTGIKTQIKYIEQKWHNTTDDSEKKTLADIRKTLKSIVTEQKTQINGSNPHLAWVLLMSFRYAVTRHFTQALLDISGVILDNISLLDNNFLRQMITEIHRQMKICNDYPVFKDEMRPLFYTVQDTNELCKMIEDLRVKGQDVTELDDIYNDALLLQKKLKGVETVYQIDTLRKEIKTDYLKPFLIKLQEEYVRRGNQHIDEDVLW